MALITRTHAATLAGVDVRTIQAWINKSNIEAKKPTSPGEPWLVNEESLKCFLAVKPAPLAKKAGVGGNVIHSHTSIPQQHPSTTCMGSFEGISPPNIPTNQCNRCEAKETLEILKEQLTEIRKECSELRTDNKILRAQIIALLNKDIPDGTVFDWQRTAKVSPKQTHENILDNNPYSENANIENKRLPNENTELNCGKTWHSAKQLADLLKMNPKYLKVRCKELGFESRINHDEGNRVEFSLNQEQLKKFMKNDIIVK